MDAVLMVRGAHRDAIVAIVGSAFRAKQNVMVVQVAARSAARHGASPIVTREDGITMGRRGHPFDQRQRDHSLEGMSPRFSLAAKLLKPRFREPGYRKRDHEVELDRRDASRGFVRTDLHWVFPRDGSFVRTDLHFVFRRIVCLVRTDLHSVLRRVIGLVRTDLDSAFRGAGELVRTNLHSLFRLVCTDLHSPFSGVAEETVRAGA
jgi:hypothetical protein